MGLTLVLYTVQLYHLPYIFSWFLSLLTWCLLGATATRSIQEKEKGRLIKNTIHLNTSKVKAAWDFNT